MDRCVGDGALREGWERKARREPEASEDLQRTARPDRREGHALLFLPPQSLTDRRRGARSAPPPSGLAGAAAGGGEIIGGFGIACFIRFAHVGGGAYVREGGGQMGKFLFHLWLGVCGFCRKPVSSLAGEVWLLPETCFVSGGGGVVSVGRGGGFFLSG
ncbi:MAG: hypothetical protein LBU37_15560 [Tannerellaceae bacterium]|nr:hypothetical protein [Tannerellaceae bacterium]